MNKLEEICAAKRDHVAQQRTILTDAVLRDAIDRQDPARGFAAAIREKAASGFALIAEIKKASPSKGLIREDFDPPAHACAYQAGGAACLSVLTDAPYFQGQDDYLVAARAAVTLPCLRKDFMVDPWQVAESRALGADAILIIMAVLDDALAAAIEAEALALGMDALTSPLLGINNRNLKTFETSLDQTERLAKLVPEDRIMISESGIFTHEDCQRLSQSGARAFLVGESLMRQDNVETATRALLTGQE